MAKRRIEDLERPSKKPPVAQAERQWLRGEGEMARRIREFDWASTPLGPMESWSPALQTMVRILLANRFPHILWWGPHYIQFYNDAYRPIPGAKHPENVLGRPGSECWAEIWPVIGPLIDQPFQGGPAIWDDDILLELHRHGFVEETHFTIAYSPVPDETAPSGIGGVLATVHEITEKVIAERRVVALRDLGARAGEARTAQEACAIAAGTLTGHPKDVPFALLYLVDADRKQARLAGTAGMTAGGILSPSAIALEGDAGGNSPWPLGAVLRGEEIEVVADLAGRFGEEVPPGPWSDRPSTAVVVPIRSNKAHFLAGFLVAGVSARLRFDGPYRDFLNLVSSQVATAIANAREHEEERKRVEALAAIDRAKTAFFSNVSHEFRTPLTLMLGPVEDLLVQSHIGLPPAAKGQLEVVNRNGLRLLRLLNTLLDFSRIEAGRVQAVFEATDLAAFTSELASVFRSATEKAGLSFIVDCPKLPEPVYVDRDMWEKIVLNLISNAFKFTLEGEIEVKLRAEPSTINHQLSTAVLRVRDTGVGIPAEELPRIFERFHRVQTARSRTHEGSGIGLALVNELVKVHGGSIRAESRLGAGATFIVSVPLGKKHLAAERLGSSRELASTAVGAAPFVEEALRWLSEAAGVEEATLPTSRHEFVPVPCPPCEAEEGASRPRIIVADDNADMRQYVARLLKERYRVEAVPDGQAALAAARERRPDLILSDVMMPNLDGFGLVRELRADAALKTIPIILLSARAGEEARVEGLQHGADDYLVKPFSAREMMARVAAHLEMARLRKEAGEQIRASEERFRSLFEHMLDGFAYCRMDYAKGSPQDFTYLDVNEAFERLTGLKNVVGKKVSEVIPGIQQSNPEVLEIYGRVALRGQPEKFETFLESLGIWLSISVYSPQKEHFVAVFDNITERKRAEQVLRQSEGRLKHAQQIANLGSWEWDFATGTLHWSEQTYRQMGLDPGSFAPTLDDFWKRVHPDDLAAFKGAVERALAQRSPYEGEFRIVRPNGEVRILSSRGEVVVGGDGEPAGMAGVCLDVTERKRAERELFETHQRLKALMQALPVGVSFSDDPTCQNVTGNSAALAQFEVSSADNLSASARDVQAPGRQVRFFKNGRGITDAELPLQRAVAENREIAPMELEVHLPSGRRWFTHASGAPIRDQQGNVIGGVAVTIDITARKQAEGALRERDEQFTTLIENLHSGVALVDEHGKFAIYNSAFLKLFGLGSEVGDINDQDWGRWQVFNEAGTLLQVDDHPVRKAALSGQPVKDRLVRVKRPCDGNDVWLLISAEPILKPNGQLRLLMCAYYDVTERRNAEAALRESEERLRRLYDAMNDGLAVHELVYDGQGRATDYRVLGVNPAYERITGISRDQAVGALASVLYGTGAAPFLDQYIPVVATGQPAAFERDFSPMGKSFYVSVFSPAPGRFATVFTDITERKRAEAAVRADLAALTRMHALSGRLLDAGGLQPLLQEVMDAAVAITGAARGTLQLLEGDSLRIVAHHGHQPPFLEFFASAESRASVCGEATRRGQRVVVPNIETSSLFAATPSLAVLREAGVRAVQSTPMMSRNGALVGILTTQWSAPYSPDEHDLWRLDLLVRQAADLIEYAQAEGRLKASLHEKEVLLKEIHHRVKNNLQVIASLVDLQADALNEPGLRQVFADIRDRVRSMALVHEKLYQSESLARVNFADYMQSLLGYLSRSHRKPGTTIELKSELQPVLLSVDKAVPCGLMLSELVSNAYKHAFRGRASGEIRAALSAGADGRVCLRVGDNGVGLPAGLDWRQCRSLGLRLIRLLSEQLHAAVEVRSGDGTELEVVFEPEKSVEQ